MTWKNLILVPFLAFTPVIVGCGADCEDLCEEANDECEGEDDDCSDSCSDLEELSEKAGCEDSYDDFLSCIDDADDICKEDKCQSEGKAFTECAGKYCLAHPNDAACTIG